MNISELRQLKDLDREIKYIQREIQKLEYKLQIGSHMITDMPKNPSKSNTTESHIVDLADYKSLLEINNRRYWRLKSDIENFISSIEDSRMRLIIRLRYVNNLHWQEIAFEIGSHDESVPRKLHNRFFRKKK